MLEDLVLDKAKRRECYQVIKDNREFMEEGKRLYEEKKNKPVTERQVQDLLSKLRNRI